MEPLHFTQFPRLPESAWRIPSFSPLASFVMEPSVKITNQKLKVMISTIRGKEGVGGDRPLGVLQEDSAP